MQKKKIIHIVDTLCVGGREKIVIDICNNLNAEVFDVYIITLTNDLNEIAGLINRNKVNLIELPVDHSDLVGAKTIFNFTKVKKLLSKKIKSINPDIIHTHSYLHRLLIIFSAIKSYSSTTAVYHTVHTSGMYYNPKTFSDYFKLRIEKLVLGILKPNLISISEIIHENNQRLFKNQSKSIQYIPNGVDLEIFDKNKYALLPEDFGAKNDDIILTYVARFCWGKNHITLLKALKIILETNSNVRLLLAGEGDTRKEIEAFISENNLQRNVILLGSISNIAELLSISTIAVFPSEFEGFTLTLIEKMAMGLPVVASNNDIFTRLICHKENGMLFSMFDENDLATCVLELLDDKVLYNKISENSKLFSKQFSLERMINEHESYYNLKKRSSI